MKNDNPTGASPAIEVSSLSKTYRSGLFGQRRFEALRNVSFSVHEGQIFGLLGPNGAGKTTFVKILLGIIRKSDGGASVFTLPAGSKGARRFVGYLPENLRMPRHLTGKTALEYYGALNGLSAREVRQKRGKLLDLVGLTDRAKDNIKTYSKGMLQRLGLAQALLHEPKMLILDEPTDGLDPVARAQVRSLLTRLKEERGVTVFLNSHLLQEVELVCDQIAILNRGELRYVGSVSDLGSQGSALEQMGLPGRHAPQATPTLEFQVTLELQGDAAAIHQTLSEGHSIEQTSGQWDHAGQSPWVVQNTLPDGQGLLRVELQMPDQAAVDQCVDLLRARGVSIVGLSRKRATLEDAFLAIVAEPAIKSSM